MGSTSVATIENRETGERITLKVGAEGPDGLALVEVNTSGNPGEPKVRIKRGNEEATLSFDPEAVVEPLPAKVKSNAKGEGNVTFDYPNANVQAVIRLYQELTGRQVVADSSVQGNLSVWTHGMVSRHEASTLIEASLVANGFSVVLHDGNSVHILGPGKPTRSDSIPIYYDEKSIPEGQSIITYVFKLKYMDVVELSNILNQYLSTGQPYTSFLPLPGSNQLIVTETTGTIRNLISLVRAADVPSARGHVTAPHAEATPESEHSNGRERAHAE